MTGGSVLMSFGTDTFTWDGGGIIYGTIDLGGDNDTARLANLTNANMGGTRRSRAGWASIAWFSTTLPRPGSIAYRTGRALPSPMIAS